MLKFISVNSPSFLAKFMVEVPVIEHQTFKLINIAFSHAENNDFLHHSILFGDFGQHFLQSVKFRMLISNLHNLSNVLVNSEALNHVFRVGFSNLNVNRIFSAKFMSNFLDFFRPSGREHEGLPRQSSCHFTNNFSNVFLKSHIEHSVGFIETNESAFSQISFV